jgi:hypothetical protein
MKRASTAIRRAGKDIYGAAKFLRSSDRRQDLGSVADLRGLIYGLAEAVDRAATMALRFEERARK